MCICESDMLQGRQTGTPGADNQRTVIVPEASPTRSHGRCRRWQSGLGAQWQDFSARQDPAAAHWARRRACRSCRSAPWEHKSVPIAPAAVLGENFLYLEIPFRNVLGHIKILCLVWYVFSTKKVQLFRYILKMTSTPSPSLEKSIIYDYAKSFFTSDWTQKSIFTVYVLEVSSFHITCL